MSSKGHQPYEQGCTKHQGETIQEYCETCGELLCTQCLHVGHAADHKTLNYADHLEKRKREATILLQRVQRMQQEIKELQKIFNEKKVTFQQGLQKSMEKIESFQNVNRAMKDWKIQQENIIDRKKYMQLQTLDEAHRLKEQNVTIERPKIWIKTKARASLHSTVKKLTPNLVLSITGATAFSRHSRHYTINQKTTFHSSSFQKRVIADDNSAIDDHSDYTDASSTSTCSDGSSGMSVTDAAQLAQKMQPPAATPECPIPRPRKPQNSKPDSQPVPLQFPASSTQLSNAAMKKKPIPTTAVLEKPPTSAAEIPHTLRPRRDTIPPGPYLNPISTKAELPEEIYDDPNQELYDDILSPTSTEPVQTEFMYETMTGDGEFPQMQHEDADGYSYIENEIPPNQPLASVQSSYQPLLQVRQEIEATDAYTSCTNDKRTTLMQDRELPPLPETPPPLPPRTGKTAVAEEYYEALYDTKEIGQDVPIYGNISDPKEITLEPTGIISSGYTAANFEESVELEDVCTAPLGSMIFTDPKNSCLRILMSTDERAHKITRQLKGQMQAVTYDQSNKRILIASEKGLNQLDFDEHRPNKITTKNVIKEIVPLCVTTTKTGDIYATTGPSYNCTDGETFIYCFKQNGKFATKLEMKGQPCGIDYKDGYLVVANLQDKNLHKIKTNGHPIWDKDVDARQKGVLHVPFRVVILPNHNIAVSERRRHCISVFSKEGQHVLRFGYFGEEPGMFNRPAGIAVRLGIELVVVDVGNKKIQLFALDKLNEQFEIAVAEKESKEAVDKGMDLYEEIYNDDPLELEV